MFDDRSTLECGLPELSPVRPACDPTRTFGARTIISQRVTKFSHSSHDSGRDLHPAHEVVVPVSLNLNVGDRTKLDGLDQIVVHIRIQARLFEGVDGRPGGSPSDEPSFQVCGRRIIEGTSFPDVLAMAANKMGPSVPIGLGVNEKNGLPDLRQSKRLSTPRPLL